MPIREASLLTYSRTASAWVCFLAAGDCCTATRDGSEIGSWSLFSGVPSGSVGLRQGEGADRGRARKAQDAVARDDVQTLAGHVIGAANQDLPLVNNDGVF